LSLFQNNLVNLIYWWDVAVCANLEPADFLNSKSHESVVARVVIHVEATGLIVRHRPKFAFRLPLQSPDIGAVISPFLEGHKIAVNLTNGLLCGVL